MLAVWDTGHKGHRTSRYGRFALGLNLEFSYLSKSKLWATLMLKLCLHVQQRILSKLLRRQQRKYGKSKENE